MSGVHFIGLTGGIGAGKSVVSRVLRTQGYAVYDCDSRAKSLMVESAQLNAELMGRFGRECISPKEINRQMLASKIFADDESREWLEKKVHAAVHEDVLRWASMQSGPCFVEAAIMSRSGLAESAERIWVVEAPEEVRLNRAMARDGVRAEQVRARMAAQQRELAALPHRKVEIIVNDGEAPLLPQIEALTASLK